MELQDQILYIIKSVTGVEATPSTLLKNLPIDSLDFVELSCILEEKFNIYSNDWVTLWDSNHTVNDLIHFVKLNIKKPTILNSI